MTQLTTTRELVVEILESANFDISKCADWIEDWTALIEAYVIEREALVLEEAAVSCESHTTCKVDRTCHLADAIAIRALAERMQPAGEANERNFGIKLDRQGGE